PYLDWGVVNGITYYDVELDTTASFSSPLHQLVPQSSSYSYYYPSNLRFGQKYYWRVRARHSTDTTSWSATWNFTTMDNVYLVAPSNGATGQDVNPYLDWGVVNGITYYDVELDTTASFSSPLHQLVPQSSSYSYYYPSNLRFGQKYYWRVRARHASDTTSWSATWNFTTHNTMTLTSPSNGAINQNVDVTLDYGAVSGITHYDVEYDTTASFNSPLHQVKTTLTGYSSYTPGNMLFGTTYYWRARSRHSADTSTWSAIWSFTTHNTMTLTSPSNGAINQNVDVTLDYGAVSGITHYDVEYDTTASFNSPLHQVKTTLTGYSSYTPGNMLFGTTYYWRARSRHSADTSTWSAIWSFTTMNSMALTSPANGATAQPVNTTLDWAAINGITHYDVEYDTTASFNSPLHQVQTTLSGYSSYTPGNILFSTTYYWRARSRHSADTSIWSSVWSFTTTDGKPVHVSPANAATGVSLNPTIDWSVVSGITLYQYEYSADPTFSSATPTGTGTTSQAGLSNLSYGQTYYWRVRTCHPADTSDWSTPWSFTTLYQLTTPVVLSSPADGTTGIATSTVNMTWQTYATAVFYEYMYADNASFNNAVSGSAVTTSQVTAPLLPGTTYYWKVRANNGSGYSPWSTAWTFATSGLAVPVLISPANGATDQNLSLTLDWQDAAAATFYEYELDDDVMFGSPIASGSPTISNAAVSSLAYNTTYYWRVRSSDGTNFSAWCSPWSFSTATLTAPTLITPANGASNQAVTNLLLDWSDISGASMYEYYYDTDINFTNPTHAIVTVSQVTITGLSNNTSYFWKVRSSDGAIYSPYSAIWSFTTETGVGIEENETNILLYPNPANENATLQFGNAAERTIRVISPTGQVVREISTNEAHFNLDLSGMNSGLYMIIIVESKEMKTLRLTIE
ncbi:MAG TPA: T9SS type A sorting domain-containing protein, partial [Bacteroidales bacterium]|nr:T9SS type A sorting domain-containing protein [Bacteroidales bacterium]